MARNPRLLNPDSRLLLGRLRVQHFALAASLFDEPLRRPPPSGPFLEPVDDLVPTNHDGGIVEIRRTTAPVAPEAAPVQNRQSLPVASSAEIDAARQRLALTLDRAGYRAAQITLDVGRQDGLFLQFS